MSAEKVMVNKVTKGQKRTTTELPCFGCNFGDFKTNSNGHEILRIIYRWKGMGVQFLQNFTQFKYFNKKLWSQDHTKVSFKKHLKH